MSGWKKLLETSTNIAILCVCILLTYVVVTKFVLPSRIQGTTEAPALGTKVNVSGVDWSQYGQTLVVALSTQCHFCVESAGFYRQLVSADAGKQTHIIAVLPQAVAESRLFLQGLGLNISDVKQVSLGTLNIGGTPTVLLVSDNGVIVRTWIGKLPASEQADVMAQIR